MHFFVVSFDKLKTFHSIEMKNLDLPNKKLGSRGKNGRIGYTNRNKSPKERTTPNL